MNAKSFSRDGSISAKIGTRRSSSNSCLRLIIPPFLYLRRRRAATSARRGFAALPPSLSLRPAVAEHQNLVEIAVAVATTLPPILIRVAVPRHLVGGDED